MGLLERMSRVIRAKLNSIISSAEDPVEQLDYAYEELRDEQNQVADSIADVTTQKKKLEIKQKKLEDQIDEHNKQARVATEEGREDLARRALEKKKSKMARIEELNESISNIESQLDGLKEKKRELDARVEDFKTQKEVQKAKYQSAKTQKKVAEATTGIGEGLSVADAMEDMEDKIEEKKARAEAVQELEDEENETFEDEIQELTTESRVEDELQSLRDEVGVEATKDTEEDSGQEDVETESEEIESLEELDTENVEVEEEVLKTQN